VSADAALLPIFVKLSGRRVLIVGGGTVAASKLDTLRPTGARVTVVAPAMCASMRQAVVELGAELVELIERPFQESDLDEAWLVVAAATPEVNAAVARAAESRRLLVNAVDDPPNASAYLGGVVRRGSATIAISTSGRAPALAGLLREGIEDVLPSNDELDAWFAEADALKRRWRSTGVPMAERRPELAEAIASRYCGTFASCRGRRDDGS
jgi:uroporphyrin-III C-methyltransferase/precorrin-2 dehydrogenase/sirohydrochlorin ferrochelatase